MLEWGQPSTAALGRRRVASQTTSLRKFPVAARARRAKCRKGSERGRATSAHIESALLLVAIHRFLRPKNQRADHAARFLMSAQEFAVVASKRWNALGECSSPLEFFSDLQSPHPGGKPEVG